MPNPPPVTLLLHRASLAEAYRATGRQIRLETADGTVIPQTGYDLEVLRDGHWHGETGPLTSSTADIDHLIVSVKAPQTVAALAPLRARLTPRSTILFLQNGCGMIDSVTEHLFPDPATRPHYAVGVVSHGVALTQPFHVAHTGPAAMSLGRVPPPSGRTPAPARDDDLLAMLPRSPRFNARTDAYTQVFQTQLEKLALNAFCNPTCALHDAVTGFLVTMPALRRAILTEISAVVLALPELQGVPGVRERFAVDRLEETVSHILTQNAETTCSMVWDMRAGRETEVRFINGYWVRRGKEVGVATPVNEELLEAVLHRTETINRSKTGSVRSEVKVKLK
ncbi:putative 2-dehydropantoate 2-reductase family protein [Aspergillus taichungensis]|uniref:2-dehydropantoate 2-reductase n=1 Tax=Aspergillus taichungensis TaxID=482145 RepID=A0A2J5I856_9EURO|nr:putative 2-dehydropantoate 2-reductase family protein [Aspergillus taichungensis]